MSQELARLGEMFREKRKELKLSLKEIENTTSIRVAHLEAIEEGNVSRLMPAIYVEGFIRQYAVVLGVDIDAILREHPHLFNISEEPQEFAYGIGTLEKRGSSGGGIKSFPNFVWILLSAGLLIAGWYLSKFLGLI